MKIKRILLPVLFIGVCSLFWFERREQKRELLELHENISSALELITQRNLYKKVIYFKKQDLLFLKKSTLFSLNFEVSAGIDLAQGWDVSLPLNPWEPVEISLPLPKILSVEAIQESLHPYFMKESLFTKIRVSDYALSIEQERESLLKEVREGSLREEAKRSAEVFFREQLARRGFENVTFSYQKNEAKR